MRDPVEIENIEEKRREAGIDDSELREQIRRLIVGDCVLLTLLDPTRVFSVQTLQVRITSIRGATLRGKVMGKPAAESNQLQPGTQLAFTKAHIHSITGQTTSRPPFPGVSAQARAAQGPPLTTAERLQRIAALGKRVAEYVEFMAGVDGLPGTSAEARDHAVAAFYERLTVLERELARIHEEFRLE